MDFYDVVRNRKSIRAYKDEPIEKDALKRIGEAVNLAPSACNIQPWSFRIIMNREIRESISSCYKNEWLKKAPAIIVALGNRDAAWKRLDGSSIINVDLGIAMEHLVLAAAAEGLGTCWICAYDVSRMNSVLGILPPWEVLAISPLGKAAENPEPRKRKALPDVFRIIE
jgi:nitroreductase